MKYCVNCGSQLDDDAVVCSKCGTVQSDIPNTVSSQPGQNQNGQNAAGQQYPQNYGRPNYIIQQKPGTTSYLVWSIILSFFCIPCGITGVIFTAFARAAGTYEDTQRNLHTAKIVCIIGTCLAAAKIIFLIVSYITLISVIASAFTNFSSYFNANDYSSFFH